MPRWFPADVESAPQANGKLNPDQSVDPTSDAAMWGSWLAVGVITPSKKSLCAARNNVQCRRSIKATGLNPCSSPQLLLSSKTGVQKSKWSGNALWSCWTNCAVDPLSSAPRRLNETGPKFFSKTWISLWFAGGSPAETIARVCLLTID